MVFVLGRMESVWCYYFEVVLSIAVILFQMISLLQTWSLEAGLVPATLY